MTFEELPAKIFENLLDAIESHDDGVVNSRRITTSEDVPDVNGNTMTFMTPYRIGGREIMATLELKLEVL